MPWKTGGGALGSLELTIPIKARVLGVGNPGPDMEWRRSPRRNLYTCSLVALDAGTGKLRWHFQFSPHDTHDWDATHVPMLLTRRSAAQNAGSLACNRNAFYLRARSHYR